MKNKTNTKKNKTMKLLLLAFISIIFLVLMIYLASADACTDWGGERTVISASSQCNVWADGYNGMTCTINGASRQCIRGKYPNDDWNVICCKTTDAPGHNECENDDDCEDGQTCQNGQCVDEENECENDDDCEDGQTCQNGQCVDDDEQKDCEDYGDGYGFANENNISEECQDNTIIEDDRLTNAQDGKVCCKLKTAGPDIQPGDTKEKEPPVVAGGDLFVICIGQMKNIWKEGYAIQKIKDKETKIGITPTECVFNFVSIIYGIGASIAFTSLGGERRIGTCAPEKPLPGSDYCNTCNEDPYRVCTKERCQILGKCIPLAVAENGTNEYRCEDGACEEKGDIDLTRIDAHWYGDTEEIGNKTSKTGSQKGTVKLELGTTLKPNEIAWNTKSIKITIKTAELAQCKYILDRANSNFSEMTDFDDNYYPQDNEQSVIIPIEGDVSRNMTHIVYIKCNNLCNLPHAPSYDYNQVKFRLEKKPDQLPPEIIFIDPASNSVLSSELDYINASFWLDEIGTCKFSDLSINFTNNYNDSREQMMIPFGQVSPNSANSSIESGGCYKAKCLDRNEQCSRCWLKLNPDKGYEIINSTNPEFNETKLYHLLIRCYDGRNIMSEDKILDYLLMTAPPYKVNITKPEEQQKDYDDTPAIEVTTGIRNTQCKYKIYPASSVPREPPKWENMTFIDNAIATIHTGEHNESLDGSVLGRPYIMHVLCRDFWNIEARDNVTFFILKDTNAPKLIRTYHDTITGDFLTIETDEESTCAFSYTGCNFNFSQGKMMTGDLQYLHSEYWRDKTFFIKCKDKWNNYPVAPGPTNSTSNPAYDYCTAILKPFDIPMIG